MAEAKKRNIRVIMDCVTNHTSDQNQWFLESRSSRDQSQARLVHLARRQRARASRRTTGSRGLATPPGLTIQKTGQYYYHYFYVQQPDLNWRNPEVRKAMYDVLRFWLDKGVAGFRIDAVSRLFEDPKLHDDPILPGNNAFGDPNIQHKYTDDLPEVHDVLREIRKLVDSYPGNPVLISEADEPNIQELVKDVRPEQR